jgi:hypothetical protein
MKQTDAREYLNHVLNNWVKFVKWHRPIAEAIEEILKENEMLQAEIHEFKTRESNKRKYQRSYYASNKERYQKYYKEYYLNKCKKKIENERMGGDTREGNQD